MNRTFPPAVGSFALVLATLATGLAAASPDRSSHDPGTIAAPQVGDAGLYAVTQSRTGPRESVTASGEILLQWLPEDVQLPSDLVRDVPTLRSSVLGAKGAKEGQVALFDDLGAFDGMILNPGKDYAAEDPILIQDRAIHLSTVPGTQAARTVVWTESINEMKVPRSQWTQRTEFARPCDLASPEAIVATLAGRARDDALGFFRSCRIEASLDGEVWHVATARLTLDLEADRRTSVPTRLVADAIQDRVRIRTEANLVGYRAGDGALRPATLPKIGESVRVVDWTLRGPTAGDLPEHPLAHAQAAIESQDAHGRSFFRDHPEARVLFATHAWLNLDPSPAPKNDPWSARVKGIRCDAAQPPVGGESAGEWTVSWVAKKASIFTISQRQPLTDSPVGATLERAIAVDTDDYGIDNSGLPALRAPAPADLAKRLSDLDAIRGGGITSIDYAFIPTANGNLQGAGAVSRGVCRNDPWTGTVRYEGSSIWFIEGQPSALVTTSIQRSEPPTIPIAGAESAKPTSALPGGRALPLVAGAAMLAGGAAAAPFVPRMLAAGYSRLAKDKLLAHPKRAAIMAAIGERPGTLLPELVVQLGIPRNTLEHHLKILRRHGLASMVRASEGLRLFAKAAAPDPARQILSRSHAPQILSEVVHGAPGRITQNDLALRVGIRKTHLSELLRDMETSGLVARQRQGRSMLVTAGPRATAALSNYGPLR